MSGEVIRSGRWRLRDGTYACVVGMSVAGGYTGYQETSAGPAPHLAWNLEGCCPWGREKDLMEFDRKHALEHGSES
jgi:hypothetical protein